MPELSRFQGMIIKLLYLDDENIINHIFMYIMENMKLLLELMENY